MRQGFSLYLEKEMLIVVRMMNILIYNRKGGVGKTTVADELMFSLERSQDNAAYIDLDDQSSSIHSDQSDMADSADIVVIDTPGALSSELQSWIENADVIVIPTNCSGRDIPMLMEALEAAREYAPDTKRIIIANRFNRFRASVEFMAVLKDAADSGEVIAPIAHGEAFQTAFSEDKSIIDVARKTNAALLTLEAVNAIRDAAGLEPDPIDPAPIRAYLQRQAQLSKERRAKHSGNEVRSNA